MLTAQTEQLRTLFSPPTSPNRSTASRRPSPWCRWSRGSPRGTSSPRTSASRRATTRRSAASSRTRGPSARGALPRTPRPNCKPVVSNWGDLPSSSLPSFSRADASTRSLRPALAKRRRHARRRGHLVPGRPARVVPSVQRPGRRPPGPDPHLLLLLLRQLVHLRRLLLHPGPQRHRLRRPGRALRPPRRQRALRRLRKRRQRRRLHVPPAPGGLPRAPPHVLPRRHLRPRRLRRPGVLRPFPRQPPGPPGLPRGRAAPLQARPGAPGPRSLRLLLSPQPSILTRCCCAAAAPRGRSADFTAECHCPSPRRWVRPTQQVWVASYLDPFSGLTTVLPQYNAPGTVGGSPVPVPAPTLQANGNCDVRPFFL